MGSSCSILNGHDTGDDTDTTCVTCNGNVCWMVMVCFLQISDDVVIVRSIVAVDLVSSRS